MKLNKGKCLTITMRGHSHTHFEDGTFLCSVPDARYLGISLDENASNKPDLNSRITATLATITALKNLWRSSAKPKWKLLVFNAIAGAKLLYGLESLQLTPADLKRSLLLLVPNSYSLTILGLTCTGFYCFCCFY